MNNWDALTVDGLTVNHRIDLHADGRLVRLTAVLRSTQLARLGATNAVAQLTLHATPTERGEYLSNDQLGGEHRRGHVGAAGGRAQCAQPRAERR